MRPLTRVRGQDTTLFFLGAGEWFGSGATPELERIARDAGRIVIAFTPQRPRTEPEVRIERSLPVEKGAARKKHVPTLFEELGVTPVTAIAEHPRERNWSGDPPRTTALWFDKLAPEWSVQRMYQNHPVWIERPWLGGSVVLLADSWMLSNEALAREPDAAALARLAGPNHNIVFDERHLGLNEGGSVAGLMRRYRLQGLIAALLVLAGLYIWKSASPLLPSATPREIDVAGLRGFSASSGLVALLERSIPPQKLLGVCIGEYRGALGRRLPEESRRKLDETFSEDARAADPVYGYEAIRKALEESRHPWNKTSKS